MRVGIPTEVHPGECRVAATPDTVGKLIKLGFDVSVQSGAGEGAKLSDDAYADAGATMVDDVKKCLDAIQTEMYANALKDLCLPTGR